MEVAVLSISPACHGQLVKMLITHEPYVTVVCLDQLHTCLFKHGSASDMQSCDEAALENLKHKNLPKITRSILTTITGHYFKDLLSKFARPTGVHYNYCVSPSIRSICFTLAGT